MTGPTAPLIVLGGPTGTGKTALSLDLAEAIAAGGGSAEIVNADALQLYRGMDIGTAKLPSAERRGIPHHLFDLWDVTETSSVAAYRDAARSTIDGILARGAVPILVGGSGLYIEQVVKAHEIPATDPVVRAELEREAERIGAARFHALLAASDPVAAARIPAANVRRVVRAREVIAITGAAYSASLPAEAAWWRPTLRVVVERPDAELAAALAGRAAGMWRDGLLDEVRHLRTVGLTTATTAGKAVGYAQAIAQLDGLETQEQAIEETRRLTWRIVRRQRSWFRRDTRALRVTPGRQAVGAVSAAARAVPLSA